MGTLTLLLPDLTALQFAHHEKRLATMELFGSRCELSISPDTTLITWVCAKHGVTRQPDWPVAALLSRTVGGQNALPYWLCAEPVQLAVDRDSLVMLPRSRLGLSPGESDALLSSIRDFFVQEGMTMERIDSTMWIIGCHDRQDLVTFEPDLAEGRSIDAYQPAGEDAPRWQRLLTEVQMLLHNHEVNAEREIQDKPPVNSLWLWGGGGVPEVQKSFDRMYVRHPLLRAIAMQSTTSLDDTHTQDVWTFSDGNLLLECETDRQSDAEASLAAIETRWLVPAWNALARGKLEEVTLVFPLGDAMIEARCDRRARQRIWKRRRPLREFFSRCRGHQ